MTLASVWQGPASRVSLCNLTEDHLLFEAELRPSSGCKVCCASRYHNGRERATCKESHIRRRREVRLRTVRWPIENTYWTTWRHVTESVAVSQRDSRVTSSPDTRSSCLHTFCPSGEVRCRRTQSLECGCRLDSPCLQFPGSWSLQNGICGRGSV